MNDLRWFVAAGALAWLIWRMWRENSELAFYLLLALAFFFWVG